MHGHARVRLGRAPVLVALVVLLGAGLQFVATPTAHAAEGTFSLTAASVPATVDSGDTIDVSLSYQCVGAPGDVCSNARIDLPWNTPLDVFGNPLPPLPAVPAGSPPEVAGVTNVGATTRVLFVSPMTAGTAGNVVIRFTTHHLMTPGGTTYAATPLATADGGSTPFGSALSFTVLTPRLADPWTLHFNPGPFSKYRDTNYTITVDVCPGDFTGYEFIPGTFYELTFFDDRITVVNLPPQDVTVVSTSPSLVIRYQPTGFFTGCWSERFGGSLVIRFDRTQFGPADLIRWDIQRNATGNFVVPAGVSGAMQTVPDELALTHDLSWTPPARHPGGSATLNAVYNLFGNAPVRQVSGLITLPPDTEFEPSELSDAGFAGWLGTAGSLSVRFRDASFTVLETVSIPSGGTVAVPTGTRYVEPEWTIDPPVQPDFTLGLSIRGRVAPTAPIGGTVSAFSSAFADPAEHPPFPVSDSRTADLLVTDPIPVPGVEVSSAELGGGPKPPLTTGTVVVTAHNFGAVAYPGGFLTVRYPPDAIDLDVSSLEVVGGQPFTLLPGSPGLIRIRWDAPIPADTTFEVRIPATLRAFSYLDTSRSVTAFLGSADTATDLVLNPLVEPCGAGSRVSDEHDDDGDTRTDGDHACTNALALRTTRSVQLAVGHANRAAPADLWGPSVTLAGNGDDAEVLLRWHNTSSMPLELREAVWTLPALGDRLPSDPATDRGSEFGLQLLAVPSTFVERAPSPPALTVQVSESTNPCPDGTVTSCAGAGWTDPGLLPLDRVRSVRLSVSGPIAPDTEFGLVARVAIDPASLPDDSGPGAGDLGATALLTAYSSWSTWAVASDGSTGTGISADSGRITFLFETTPASQPGPGRPGAPGADPDGAGQGTGREAASSGRGNLAFTGGPFGMMLVPLALAAVGTGAALGRRRGTTRGHDAGARGGARAQVNRGRSRPGVAGDPCSSTR